MLKDKPFQTSALLRAMLRDRHQREEQIPLSAIAGITRRRNQI